MPETRMRKTDRVFLCLVLHVRYLSLNTKFSDAKSWSHQEHGTYPPGSTDFSLAPDLPDCKSGRIWSNLTRTKSFLHIVLLQFQQPPSNVISIGLLVVLCSFIADMCMCCGLRMCLCRSVYMRYVCIMCRLLFRQSSDKLASRSIKREAAKGKNTKVCWNQGWLFIEPKYYAVLFCAV